MSQSWRVCESFYTVQAAPHSEGATRLYLMALQPTKRGAWSDLNEKKKVRLHACTTIQALGRRSALCIYMAW